MTIKKIVTTCVAILLVCLTAVCGQTINIAGETVQTELDTPSVSTAPTTTITNNLVFSTLSTSRPLTTTEPQETTTKPEITSTAEVYTVTKAETLTRKSLIFNKTEKQLDKYTPRTFEYEILSAINNERIKNGLNKLNMNTELCSIAAIRSKEASINWSHVRPNGTMCESIFEEYNIPAVHIGENLAKSTVKDCELIMNGWMNSPTHRDNILENDYNDCGIAIYEASDGRVYIATIFSK